MTLNGGQEAESNDYINRDAVMGQPNKKSSKIKNIFVAIFYIFLWPIFIGLIGLGIGATAYILSDGVRSRGTFYVILYTTVLLVCYALIKYFEKTKHKYSGRRIGANVLKVYTVFGLGVIVLSLINTMNTQPLTRTDTVEVNQEQIVTPVIPTIPKLSHDETIDNKLRSLGVPDAEISRLSTAYVDNFSTNMITDQSGLYSSTSSNADGRFLYGSIQIKSGLTPANDLTSIAHEYIHHAWYALFDGQTRYTLTSHLITIYGRNYNVQTRLAGYSGNDTLSPTELLSYLCTEFSDAYLTNYVKDTCNQYVNRSLLTMRY